LQAKSGTSAALAETARAMEVSAGSNGNPSRTSTIDGGRAAISQIAFVDIARARYGGAPPIQFDLFDVVRIACSARAKARRRGSRPARHLNKKLILM
jgi:hypothetical protein